MLLRLTMRKSREQPVNVHGELAILRSHSVRHMEEHSRSKHLLDG